MGDDSPKAEGREDEALLLTANAAAALCSVSVRQWWRWDSAGQTPRAVLIGRTKRWPSAPDSGPTNSGSSRSATSMQAQEGFVSTQSGPRTGKRDSSPSPEGSSRGSPSPHGGRRSRTRSSTSRATPPASSTATSSRAGIPRRIDGLGKVDFHACRVAYTTLVVESGANVKEAQELLRHSTPQLTMEAYARGRSERLGRVADSVGQMVLGAGQIAAPTEPPLSPSPKTSKALTPLGSKALQQQEMVEGTMLASKCSQFSGQARATFPSLAASRLGEVNTGHPTRAGRVCFQDRNLELRLLPPQKYSCCPG